MSKQIAVEAARVTLDPRRATWEGRPTQVKVDGGEWFKARIWLWAPPSGTAIYTIEAIR